MSLTVGKHCVACQGMKRKLGCQYFESKSIFFINENCECKYHAARTHCFIGTTICNIRFFALEPRAIKVFSFGRDIVKPDDALMESQLVRDHAKSYVRMVDRAVDMLGPDVELLTEILLDLGVNHSRFGVEVSFYPPMGQALILTLEEMLGDKFTTEKKESWLECYAALSYAMMRANTLRKA
eukprot:scaffold4306_cov154-Cylindrotheca_fusiformis.AAC.3